MAMCSSFEPSLAQQTQLELMARKTIRTLEQISNKSPRGVAVFQKFDVEYRRNGTTEQVCFNIYCRTIQALQNGV